MNQTTQDVESATVVIFGASGDLTRRKLIPALHSLGCEGLLPKTVQVLGVARSPLTDEDFRARLHEGLVVPGPAIVSEMDSTTVILPGHQARVDAVGNLLIEPGA